jgi:hypothetical protein
MKKDRSLKKIRSYIGDIWGGEKKGDIAIIEESSNNSSVAFFKLC